MVIVFILISIVMIIIGGILLSRDTAIAEESTLGQVLTVVGYIFLILSILTGAILGFVLANRMIVDDTILLYSEENKKIEEQVAEIVDGYLEYEQETVQKYKTGISYCYSSNISSSSIKHPGSASNRFIYK